MWTIILKHVDNVLFSKIIKNQKYIFKQAEGHEPCLWQGIGPRELYYKPI